jgi:23S rRNA pseudouridine1911/1915/1917 synthase
MRGGKRPIPAGAPGHPRTGSDQGYGQSKKKAFAARTGKPPKDAREEPVPEEFKPRKRSPVVKGAMQATLVYDDEELLAYDKGPGLSVIAPEGSRTRCLLDIATSQIRRKNPKGRAAVVHRIDRDTSGIVIFAKSGSVKKTLMKDWDELVSERLYVAVVEGSMGGADPGQGSGPNPSSGVFDSWLKEDDKGRVFTAKPGERGSKRAITRWRVLREGAGLSLLELSLETGRKHQIRVQLADSGHPVLGDERYRAARDDIGRLALHAKAIELKLPGRKALRIESPVPEAFERALNARRASSASSPTSAKSASRPKRSAPRG